ncbi:MAG: PQQ-binding-like beta-propeller repeat protein [Pirellulaceae bacterium]|nr:PQQ-binding-like beta-propeller repeat protein [Planctomycetales bacterium]
MGFVGSEHRNNPQSQQPTIAAPQYRNGTTKKQPDAIRVITQVIIVTFTCCFAQRFSGSPEVFEALLFAVLPIIPSLLGLFSVIPALLGGLIALWTAGGRLPGRYRREDRVWRRFWVRQLPSLLVMTSLVVLGGWATVGRAVRLMTPTVAGMSSEDQWPMPRGNLQRTGMVDQSRLPANGDIGILWRFRPPGTTFYGDAAVHGDNVYVVGSRGDTGTIYAVSRNGGQVRWSCRPAGYRATLSSPVIANDTLFVGEGLHYTRNARLVAVALAGPQTGQVLWTFRTNGHIECTPTIVDDCIYFAAGDDGVYCLQISPTGRPPVLRWHARPETVPDADISVSVANGLVYVGTGNGGESLVVLDAQNGTEVARWHATLPVRALPAFSTTHLAICAGRGDLKVLGSNPGSLLLRERGQVERSRTDNNPSWTWQGQLPGIMMGALTVYQETFVGGCADGFLRRFTSNGNCMAQWDSGAPMAGSLVTDGHVIVGHNRDGRMFALDGSDLSLLWNVSLGPPGNYIASPVAADGHLFIGTDADGLLCIGQVAGRDL